MILCHLSLVRLTSLYVHYDDTTQEKVQWKTTLSALAGKNAAQAAEVQTQSRAVAKVTHTAESCRISI